jgi:hypothetical protein
MGFRRPYYSMDAFIMATSPWGTLPSLTFISFIGVARMPGKISSLIDAPFLSGFLDEGSTRINCGEEGGLAAVGEIK